MVSLKIYIKRMLQLTEKQNEQYGLIRGHITINRTG